jgi:hypothetical protein
MDDVHVEVGEELGGGRGVHDLGHRFAELIRGRILVRAQKPGRCPIPAGAHQRDLMSACDQRPGEVTDHLLDAAVRVGRDAEPWRRDHRHP